jgi:proliferating cell nuclear antigen
MFAAKSASPTEWRTIGKLVGTLVDEATFTATPEGVSLRAIDPAKVAMVEIFLPNSAFEKYECDKERRFTVRVPDFTKIFERADEKDRVEISTDEKEGTLHIKFVGYKQGYAEAYIKQFTLHLLETPEQQPPPIKLNLNAKIKLDGEIFRQILSDIKTISETVTIEAKQNQITFTGKGDIGTALATLERESPHLFELTIEGDKATSTYRIDYLHNTLKALAPKDALTLEYSTKMPLKLQAKLGEQGKITFYLAPVAEDGR